MLEPLSRSTSQDVFGFHSVVARKFLDSFSIFDWGRMPDSIPNRGRFNAFLEAFINLRIASKDEWTKYFRSPEAHAFRKSATSVLKSGKVTANLKEVAEVFPMQTSDRGLIRESSFKAGVMDPLQLTSEVLANDERFYLLSDPYPEEKILPITVMGKPLWDFSVWKKNPGKKALPFEIECSFESGEFPEVTFKCPQKTISPEVSYTEALLITGLTPEKLQELILRSAWISGMIQYQLRTVHPVQDRKVIRIRMGMDTSVDPSTVEFVYLGSSIEFCNLEEELQRYYSTTVWGRVIQDIRQQAREKGIVDWKRSCSEPAPWLDSKLKAEFSSRYQQMISGIASCLSE
jgi:hypothetical protein